MKIMIDTSVWIACREDGEFRKTVEIIAEKNEVRSSEVIDKELGKATEFSDWCGSAAFYAMYHSLLAILAKFGYESGNQEFC